jgi:hypothetical protein
VALRERDELALPAVEVGVRCYENCTSVPLTRPIALIVLCLP